MIHLTIKVSRTSLEVQQQKKKKNHSDKQPYILLIAASFTGAQGNR